MAKTRKHESQTYIVLNSAPLVVRGLYDQLDKYEKRAFAKHAYWHLTQGKMPKEDIALHAFSLIRNPGPYMSYQQIAEALGITIERVRQIHDTAIKKIARKLDALGYEQTDFGG